MQAVHRHKQLITSTDLLKIAIGSLAIGCVAAVVLNPPAEKSPERLDKAFSDFALDARAANRARAEQQPQIDQTQVQSPQQQPWSDQPSLGQQPKQSTTQTVNIWQIQDTSIPCTSGMPGNHVAWSAEHGRFMNFCLVQTTQEVK